MDLIVNPPNRKQNSLEVVEKHEKEVSDLLSSLKIRADLVTEYLGRMTNVQLNEVEGAMYAFPRIHLSESAI